MTQLRFGIVGTGMIAGVIGDAIDKSTSATLTAVTSRSFGKAVKFAEKRKDVVAIEGINAFLNHGNFDAVYVATPTSVKEEIALAMIAAGKHVLVDKPFVSRASVERMVNAARTKGVAFMDATHFVHHPRTKAIQSESFEKIATPQSLHTAFYIPFEDRRNIRFDASQEPMTAMGDMAWYSMRAIVEYLRPEGRVSKVASAVKRDSKTNTVVQAAGLVAFEDGKSSTFDVGYTAGTVLMDLCLIGTQGAISMDDFVLDWTNSFAFKNRDIKTGYFHRRRGMATREQTNFIPTPAEKAQEILMIDNFSDLTRSGAMQLRKDYADASLKTQELLDAIWTAAGASS